MVYASAILATLIPLGIPRGNCHQFSAKSVTALENIIRLGIKFCSCSCNCQNMNALNQKELHVITLMTRVS